MSSIPLVHASPETCSLPKEPPVNVGKQMSFGFGACDRPCLALFQITLLMGQCEAEKCQFSVRYVAYWEI